MCMKYVYRYAVQLSVTRKIRTLTIWRVFRSFVRSSHLPHSSRKNKADVCTFFPHTHTREVKHALYVHRASSVSSVIVVPGATTNLRQRLVVSVVGKPSRWSHQNLRVFVSSEIINRYSNNRLKVRERNYRFISIQRKRKLNSWQFLFTKRFESPLNAYVAINGTEEKPVIGLWSVKRFFFPCCGWQKGVKIESLLPPKNRLLSSSNNER